MIPGDGGDAAARNPVAFNFSRNAVRGEASIGVLVFEGGGEKFGGAFQGDLVAVLVQVDVDRLVGIVNCTDSVLLPFGLRDALSLHDFVNSSGRCLGVAFELHGARSGDSLHVEGVGVAFDVTHFSQGGSQGFGSLKVEHHFAREFEDGGVGRPGEEVSGWAG